MNFYRLLHRTITLTVLSFALVAHAGDLPAPVNGISFDEWTAANARLANEQPLAEVLEILEVDDAAWQQANTAFLQALAETEPGSEVMARYAEVFAEPAVGRFAGESDQPQEMGKLASFDDYARVQGHLSAAAELGQNPQEVLAEHNLNAYEFSQESRRWIDLMMEQARTGNNGELQRMNQLLESYKDEYRKR